jgi:hypothetical protein
MPFATISTRCKCFKEDELIFLPNGETAYIYFVCKTYDTVLFYKTLSKWWAIQIIQVFLLRIKY